jgi:drug/metabolite transporter (DMT)-like permease
MAGTAFLWSIAGLCIKTIDWNPLAIAGARSFIASLVILVYLRRPNLHFSFPQVAAAVANTGTMLLFVSANKTTTAANAILLQYFSPVLTVLLGALMVHERPKPEQLAALPLVTAGMIIMFLGDLGGGRLLGNILSLASAGTFSLYFVFMRMQKDGSPLESILLSHWLTAGICAIAQIFLPAPHFTVKSLAAVSALGLFQIGLSAILFSAAIKRVPAAHASLIAVIEPVFNPLWVFLALGEAPKATTLIGGGIIIAAVVFSSTVSMRRVRNSKVTMH